MQLDVTILFKTTYGIFDSLDKAMDNRANSINPDDGKESVKPLDALCVISDGGARRYFLLQPLQVK